MSHFYVILPSNSSMSYYPSNTVTKYMTHLLQPISLEGDWEVGLFEFEYYRTWYNVEEKDSKIRFDHMKDEKVVRERTHISHGYYTSIEELTDRIDISFIFFGVESGITQMPQLRLDKLTRKISIHIFNGMRIIISPGLGNILLHSESRSIRSVWFRQAKKDTTIKTRETYKE